MSVREELERRLREALEPESLELVDESDAHAGHAGAGRESHWRVRVRSARFAGLGRVERQRLVFGALGELMKSRVHALSIEARAPGE